MLHENNTISKYAELGVNSVRDYLISSADAVNTANGLIREGKYAEALQILLEYQKDDRAFNSIGVCHMMLENEEEAIGWFERALLTGHEEARKNLEQLK